MKNTFKNFGKLAFVLTFGAMTFSCTEDDDANMNEPQSNIALSATAESSSPEGRVNDRVIVNGFATSQFAVGTKDIEMKYAAKADLLAGISIGNITLKSNVNTALHTESSKSKNAILVNDGTIQVSALAEGRSPDGNYTEVDFRLFKKMEGNSNDPMFEKSLWIAGEIDGKISTIWLTSEKALKARSQNAAGVEVDGQTEMVLAFDMDKLFANVNFSTAVDANSDGKIDIGPNSADGNATILAQIESNLESAVVLKRR
ncbi:hypothetical protein Belba_0815 [Belliella baltica DSM 15883]|uniref:Lipoprotein n=1 Tax=Belliella baltica (strain DSM 15883 / CIP 108006 / LMG 21964 / BA134) TaxID=866536 RepID=I3Z2J5_BELBD|nr:hypothetical protein [Belliella baltica]AFL83463.1 hypothetical protein Belba_0815 [Belliella baltica DSM 15883]